MIDLTNKTITIPCSCGYNGHQTKVYAEPIEPVEFSRLVELRVAEPGLEGLTKWVYRLDWEKAVSEQLGGLSE